MNNCLPFREGFINVPGGSVWFKIVGEDKINIPLLVIHGGPGDPHHYLNTLEKIAEDRPVIFYDQLGCGKSAGPTDPALWTVERYLAELEAIIDYFDYEHLHIFGHSWGTILAAEFSIKHQFYPASLILASPALNMERWIEDTNRLKNQLPDNIKIELGKYEAENNFESIEYQNFLMEYYKRYVCRTEVWPDQLIEASQGVNYEIYRTMIGPTEYLIRGNLGDYNCTNKLKNIKCPVLLTCGKYDQATPETTNYYKSLIEDSAIIIFEKSAHVPHIEERANYISWVRMFLHEKEKLIHNV